MRLIDIDYAAFVARLNEAAVNGERIQKTDRERWKAYVRKLDVKEAGALVYAKGLSDTLVPVIIESKDEWTGYYLYSKRDEVCVKYDPGR